MNVVEKEDMMQLTHCQLALKANISPVESLVTRMCRSKHITRGEPSTTLHA